jgi:hypothetical protein
MIIVSLTTYPKRYKRLKEVLPYILNQTLKFDKLCIVIDDNIAENEIQDYLLLKDLDSRIEILFGESKWRSANKLLTTYKKYPNDIIITCDDDMYYPNTAFQEMYDVWLKNKECIIAQEINPAQIDCLTVKYINSFDVMLRQKEFGKYLSVCCLFPPRSLEDTDVYNYDNFKYVTNGNHDELWFWIHTTIKGIYVIGLDYTVSYQIDEVAMKFDETALTNINGNPKEIEAYIERYNKIYGLKLLNTFNTKPIIFDLEYNNLFAFIGNIQWIWHLYHNMSIQLNLGKTIHKSHLFLINGAITKLQWKSIKLNRE